MLPKCVEGAEAILPFSCCPRVFSDTEALKAMSCGEAVQHGAEALICSHVVFRVGKFDGAVQVALDTPEHGAGRASETPRLTPRRTLPQTPPFSGTPSGTLSLSGVSRA